MLRHAGLFEAVLRLDAEVDPRSRQELVDWVAGQYRQEHGDVPLGFVARCLLGPPYVDHRLDLLRSIVEHYGPSDPVPTPFDAARMLARSRAYEFVEVWGSGQLVGVRTDGTIDQALGRPS